MPILYCFPFTANCRPMADWVAMSQIIGVVAALVFGFVGAWKILVELRRIAELREKENEDRQIASRLKRTEFFLDQHRRLFDDEVLYEVLCLIDADDDKLRDQEMWDKKRKLLTFFEEIALLVRSEQIRGEVAFYMFGYYARCARDGKNFCVGIDLAAEHWGLFFWFAKQAEDYAKNNESGPPSNLAL